jgi:NTE family protein
MMVATMPRRSDPLAEFDSAALAELDAALTTQRIAGGDVLYEAGDAPDGLAIITRGHLAVLDGEGNRDGVFGRGDVIGEIGAVSGLPRTRSVVATRDTELRVMSQERFEELFREHPSVGREIARLVATRLITEGDRAAPTRVPSTLAVVTIDEAIDPAHLVTRLRGVVGRSTVITRNDRAADPAEWMTMLDRVELDHELTILDAGPVGADDDWLDLCVRQADTVVVLATPDDPRRWKPPMEALRARLDERRAVTELVMVNPSTEATPADATRLCVVLGPDRLHQVKAGDDASTDRAARLVLGRGTALVLSGGGARGMAHIGVWRAITELGIDIDAVSGVSFGALMAWGISLDFSPDRLHEVTRQRLVDAKRVFDFTLPIVSVLRGRNIAKSLRAINGDRTFGELWRPFVCSSADLTTGELVDHDNGPVWAGVRASLSIPGAFTPMRQGDRLLVDGGVLDNLPIRSTRAAHPGPLEIIAVDVGDSKAIVPGTTPEDGTLSGWGHLARRAMPRQSDDVPSIARIMLRVIELSGASAGAADHRIRPDLDGFGFGDFSKIDELEQRGYDAAMAVLG